MELTRERYNEIIDDTEKFAGTHLDKIPEWLERKYKLTKDEIRQFGKWLLEEGLRDEWLLVELGF